MEATRECPIFVKREMAGCLLIAVPPTPTPIPPALLEAEAEGEAWGQE